MRVRIRASGEVGIGIGNAVSLLHQHRNTGIENYHQITNSTTGSANTTDGFRVGISSSGGAELRQEEDNSITFFTGGSAGIANRMYIEGSNGSSTYGRVGIGTTTPVGRLSVLNTTATGSGSSSNSEAFRSDNSLGASETQHAYGIYTTSANGSLTTGISAIVDNTSNNTGVIMKGMYMRVRASNASNVQDSYGIDLLNDANTPTNNKFGISIDVSGSATTRYGIKAAISGALTAPTDYAVYGSVTDTSDWAGYFVGKVYSSKYFTTSDAQLKENINDLTDALSTISQLSPKTFTFKADDYPYLTLNKTQNMGLIAQDLETVLPELVTNVHQAEVMDSAGNEVSPAIDFKAVDYQQLIPLLIQGIKEQQQQIDDLTNAINNLRTAPSSGDRKQQTIELNNVQGVILNQNDPNPFNETTSISYYIPSEVQNAIINFYNDKGILLNSIEITERGNGELQVFGSELNSGTYIYSIVADGKLVSSHKMIKTK